jgi:preprotein translocase subunit SecE
MLYSFLTLLFFCNQIHFFRVFKRVEHTITWPNKVQKLEYCPILHTVVFGVTCYYSLEFKVHWFIFILTRTGQFLSYCTFVIFPNRKNFRENTVGVFVPDSIRESNPASESVEKQEQNSNTFMLTTSWRDFVSLNRVLLECDNISV